MMLIKPVMVEAAFLGDDHLLDLLAIQLDHRHALAWIGRRPDAKPHFPSLATRRVCGRLTAR